MKKHGLYTWVLVALLGGCSSHHPNPHKTLIATEPITPQSFATQTDTENSNSAMDTSENAANTTNGPIDLLVQRDAQIAKNILITDLSGNSQSNAAWAAVYIQYLEIQADKDAVYSALAHCTQHEQNILLQSLCWRWIAQAPRTPLPSLQNLPEDPVPQIFASISYQKANQLPKELTTTLVVGQATNEAPEITPFHLLRQRLLPFDNTLVANAIAFVNARRMALATKIEGITVPVSAAHQRRILQQLDTTVPEKIENTTPFAFDGTALNQVLQYALEQQSVKMLRRAIVHSKGSLQLEALRVLAMKANPPEAGDLAAAAAALRSTDPQIQLEAARTYLLLVKRTMATSKQPLNTQ